MEARDRMRRLQLTATLSIALILCATRVSAQWQPDGVLDFGGNPCPGEPRILIADGNGGAVFVRYFADSSFVHRVDSGGRLAAGWPARGKFIGKTLANGAQRMIRDGLGGYFLVGREQRGQQPYKLFLYRINGDGSLPTGWDASGASLVVPSGSVQGFDLMPDGVGGAFVVWTDATALTTSEIRLLRLGPEGLPAAGWPAQGLLLDFGPGQNSSTSLVSDGNGGAIVIATNQPDPSIENVYAERVNSDATLGWNPPSPGRLMMSGATFTAALTAVSDGAGGALSVIFRGTSTKNSLYAQRIDGNGALNASWPASGKAIALAHSAVDVQDDPRAIPDGQGGCYVTWTDQTNVNGGTYLHHILATGANAPGWPDHGLLISSATDFGYSRDIATDLMGGTYCLWWAYSSQRTRLSHLTPSGTPAPGWPASGIDVAPDSTSNWSDTPWGIVPDDQGGVIAAWTSQKAASSFVRLARFGTGGAVAAQAALVSMLATPDEVALAWTSDDSKSTVFSLERLGSGSYWTEIARLSPDGTGQLSYRDRAVVPEARYSYQLRWNVGGVSRYSPETSVTVPSAYRFALAGARPNPVTDGDFSVRFSLAEARPAALEMYDIVGRRVLLKDVSALGAGNHVLRLDTERHLRPGVYWLKLTQGAQTATSRVAVTN